MLRLYHGREVFAGVAGRPRRLQQLEPVPKKRIDFFGSDMLQLFEFERFLFDHVIPRDWEAL
jgi:hypothetical protein